MTTPPPRPVSAPRKPAASAPNQTRAVNSQTVMGASTWGAAGPGSFHWFTKKQAAAMPGGASRIGARATFPPLPRRRAVILPRTPGGGGEGLGVRGTAEYGVRSTGYGVRGCPLTPDPSPPPGEPPTGPRRARAGERGEDGPLARSRVPADPCRAPNAVALPAPGAL